MARHAGGGKATIEGCRSIDVLEWHRRGYLRSPRWFSWTWSRDGERVASINAETQRHSVTLKYRSRSYDEEFGVMSCSRSPSPGRRVGSAVSGPGLCARLLQTECIAAAASPSCTAPGAFTPAATAISLPMRANRSRHISAASGNHKRSECGWAEAQTCLRSFPTSQEACTGGPISDGAKSTMWPKSDHPLACWAL